MSAPARIAALCTHFGLQRKQALIVYALFEAGERFTRWRDLVDAGCASTADSLKVQLVSIRHHMGEGTLQTDKPHGYRLTTLGREQCRHAFQAAVVELQEPAEAPALISGTRDLWVDGRCHTVSVEVWAHVRFLSSVVSNLARSCSRLAERERPSEAA